MVFVDDDEATNAFHRIIAAKADVAEQTLFFISAKTALKYLSEIKSTHDFPELIFTDINMPGMDGHEFIDAVRELPFYYENTVLVYLITTLSNCDVAIYTKKGMKHIYFKSLKAEDLIQIVKDYTTPSGRHLR